MDNRPIGVFDSGLGGLTAVKALRRLLPGEDLIYFGDTARVPYGGRSRETLLKYARQDIAFLRSFDLKAVLIACGTVTSTSLDTLRKENDLPVLGVVEPSCREALAVTKNKKIGMIATLASARSGAYERTLKGLDADVQVVSQPCPLFVPLVENGYIGRGCTVTREVAADYLAPLADYLEAETDADFAFFVGAIGGLIRTTKEHEYPDTFVPRNDRHKFWIITQVTGQRIGELTLSVDNEFELVPKLNFTTTTFETALDNFLLGAVASLGIIDTRVYIKDVSTGLRETAEGFGNLSLMTSALADAVAIYNQYKDSGLSTSELLSYSLASFAQTYFSMVQDNLTLCATTEMSYMEFYQKNGTRTKAVVLTPGEMFAELVYGGLLEEVTGDLNTDPHNPSAENPETFVEIAARYGKSFGAGHEDLLVFGLSNDMTGYVVPPNDFVLNPTLPYINDYRVTPDRKHYEETNSVGPNMAYVMAENFEALLAGIGN